MMKNQNAKTIAHQIVALRSRKFADYELLAKAVLHRQFRQMDTERANARRTRIAA